jgi:hypothetical protein
MEVVTMTTLTHTKTKITPWDDPAFVRTFEQVRDAVAREGRGEGPTAAAEVQRCLREAGYPHARVDVVRSAAEALEKVSHWIVSRDG